MKYIMGDTVPGEPDKLIEFIQLATVFRVY